LLSFCIKKCVLFVGYKVLEFGRIFARTIWGFLWSFNCFSQIFCRVRCFCWTKPMFHIGFCASF
jgi:hypothetical protein